MRSAWWIRPRDPLVVRDGRPNDGRSESSTLPFPLPGTIAGGLRTRLGWDDERGFVLSDRLADLLRVSMRGPLLSTDGDSPEWLVPAPADAVVGKGADGVLRLRSLALIDDRDWRTDPAMPEDLRPVGLSEADGSLGKPPVGVPSFWTWSMLQRWLEGRLPDDGEATGRFLADGLLALPRETRMHVAIDPDSSTHIDGALFGTTGLRFQTGSSASDELQLWLDFDGQSVPDRRVAPGAAPLAGERRLVQWAACSRALPAPPPALIDRVGSGEATLVRCVLLTPAAFDAGFRPTAGRSPLLPEGPVTGRLVAAAVGRPITVSGWDLARRRPKPSRRLAPAGSVYWVEVSGEPDARRTWLEQTWLTNGSDADQDRRDGCGLVAFGADR